MIWITHIAFGVLLGIIFEPMIGMDSLAYYSMIIFFSLLPDIDKHDSKIGNKTPVISHLIENVFGHRGLFHSPLAMIVFGYLILHFISQPVALVFLVGYGSHLLIDSFTKSGINLLYPLTTFKLKGFVKTSGALEYFILFLIVVFIIYLI